MLKFGLGLVVAAALVAPVILAQTPATGPVDRFDLLPTRPDDLGPPVRVARFIHSTDVHVLDDDAPYPLRQESLDTLGPPFESAQRPQEEYTDEAFNALLFAFDAAHWTDPVDFVIFTGDNIDNTLENEVVRFIDNVLGTYTDKGPITGLAYKPDGQSANPDDTSNDVTDAATSLPAVFQEPGYNIPLDPAVPWYVVFGNHDGLIQGNAPIEPSFREYAARHGRYFVDQQEYIAMFFQNPALHGTTKLREFCALGPGFPNDGRGFANAGARLCDTDPDNDGYYTFDHGPFHHIVLDTMNDDFVQSNGHFGGTYQPGFLAGAYAGGYAEGTLDPKQFEWLKAELDANKTRPTIVHAHHTINSFVINQEGSSSPAQQLGYVSGPQLVAELNQHAQVVFYIGGHTHKHLIQPKGTFWNVETASLIDPPHENRLIEIFVAPNKTGYLQTSRIVTPYQKIIELGATDPDEEGDPNNRRGGPLDRDVRLWFALADPVFEPIRATLDRKLVGDLTSDATDSLAGTTATFSFNLTRAFTQGAPPASTEYYATVESPSSMATMAFPLPVEAVDGRGTFIVNFTTSGVHAVALNFNGPDVDAGAIRTTLTVPELPEVPAQPGSRRGIPLDPWILLAAVGVALAACPRRD